MGRLALLGGARKRDPLFYKPLVQSAYADQDGSGVDAVCSGVCFRNGLVSVFLDAAVRP